MISEWVCTIVSLTKEHPWAEFLTNLPRRGVGTLPSVSEFNHERVPMSCLQWLDALKVNIWTSNNVQRSHQQLWSQLLTTHNTLDSMSMVFSGHQLKVCSVFVLHCELFRSIFMFLRKYDCWLSNYWLPQGTGNFQHDISSIRSKLSTWNEVKCIAKACRYNISKNEENVVGSKRCKLVVWRWSIACWLYLWFLNSYKHGAKIVYRETLGVKHITGWTVLDINVQVLRSSGNSINSAHCTLIVKISYRFWRTVAL